MKELTKFKMESNLHNLNGMKGWIFSSLKSKSESTYSELLQLGRTNFNDPWKDNGFHYHTLSQELYLLTAGELWLLVEDKPIIMQGFSLLLVQPYVVHAIVGGKGKIQHYSMKVPHKEDKKIKVTERPENVDYDTLFSSKECIQEYSSDSFFVIDLDKEKNQNLWVLGTGESLYKSNELSLAFMNFQSLEDYRKLNRVEDYHYHTESTEWYLTIEGKQKLLVNENEIEIDNHSLLRVPKKVPHKLIEYTCPFRGITIRTPLSRGDKVVVE